MADSCLRGRVRTDAEVVRHCLRGWLQSQPSPEDRLLQALDLSPARLTIAAKILALLPAGSTPRQLASAVFTDLSWRARFHDSTRLRAELTALIRRDFEVGRTLEVEGWILSLTEARLAAISNLLATAPAATATAG